MLSRYSGESRNDGKGVYRCFHANFMEYTVENVSWIIISVISMCDAGYRRVQHNTLPTKSCYVSEKIYGTTLMKTAWAQIAMNTNMLN